MQAQFLGKLLSINLQTDSATLAPTLYVQVDSTYSILFGESFCWWSSSACLNRLIMFRKCYVKLENSLVEQWFCLLIFFIVFLRTMDFIVSILIMLSSREPAQKLVILDHHRGQLRREITNPYYFASLLSLHYLFVYLFQGAFTLMSSATWVQAV